MKMPDQEIVERRNDAISRGVGVIRFFSPLTIQDEVFAEALDILEKSLLECAKET
ncbi:4-aminobutyrate aminotransferase-like enzyme (plasmid) [Ensifer sp. WSM1721]|uniref:hypothetical protein n=1 Tax=Ensifer sp. WSM1721 TaxID=1041159 RepID=UPI0004ACC174|nr:hypothetical protein [Ensifer sp. WSM1721]